MEQSVTTKRDRPLIILMADDDRDDCALIKEAFVENKLETDLRFVENGEDLLDYLRHRSRYAESNLSPRPCLILLDLNMPIKDGREALKEIKSDPDLRRIPIVVLSTSGEERDVLLSYDLGACSFITKPVMFAHLVELVKSLSVYWLEMVVLPPENKPH